MNRLPSRGAALGTALSHPGPRWARTMTKVCAVALLGFAVVGLITASSPPSWVLSYMNVAIIGMLGSIAAGMATVYVRARRGELPQT